jgi:hypothetical protein
MENVGAVQRIVKKKGGEKWQIILFGNADYAGNV